METRESRWLWGLHIVATLLALASLLGCNRAHYRRQADVDAHALIQEKTNSGHWAIPNYSVFVDPRSRMFDPFAVDTPPMPKDDPYAHQFMHEVDGKKGYPGWHYTGSTTDVDNPSWRDYLPLDSRGVLLLDSATVMRLARLHSRPYQQEVEELYLSALDVSFERFRFDTQFFAGYNTDYIVRGNRGGNVLTAATFNNGRPISGAEVSAGGGRGLTMRRSFITGADLMVNFANTLVFNFSGSDTSVTLLDFSLIQPLLRSAGRDRILERLTVSERSLLANVRSMQRYQQAFYVDVMTGRSSANTGPTRRGGVLGGSGLDGFSGLGSSGFGRLNVATAGGAGGAGGGQAQGYMGLLQQQLQIRNQEINIKLLRDNLEQLREQLAEERQKPLGATGISQNTKITRLALQVEQAQQALVNAEAQLINALNNFEGQLDTFKVNLGLPPDICVEIVDPMLSDFYLLEDAIEQERQDFRGLRQDVGKTLLSVRQQIRDMLIERGNQTADIHILDWTPLLAQDLTQLDKQMRDVLEVPARLEATHLRRAAEDLEKLRRNIPRRKEQLARLEREFIAQRERTDPCELLPLPLAGKQGQRIPTSTSADAATEIFSPARVDEVLLEIETNFNRLRDGIQETEQKLQEFQQKMLEMAQAEEELTPLERGSLAYELLAEVNEQFDNMKRDILDLELLQARIRSETVSLVPIELSWQSAVDIAYRYRLDLMNARASLVDQWRLIEFNADNLESTLDLVFSGDLTHDLNRDRNPTNIPSGQIRAGLRFDAPIVRLSERNTYRQTLIEYQQARRSFYAGLDEISRSMRQTLRTMEANRLNFEIQRLAVSVAARQNNYNSELLQLTQSGGDTAARDTVQALSDLLSAQNNFLSLWVSYEVLRRTLDLDLGTMLLDDEGIWIDPGPIGPDHLERMQGIIDFNPLDGWEFWSDGNSEPQGGENFAPIEEELPTPGEQASSRRSSLSQLSPVRGVSTSP